MVAHPGHELKVYGWLAENAPRVYILTDGSGGRASRVASSEKVLGATRSVPGEIFGQFSDAEIYRTVLERRIATVLGLVDGLAGYFVQHRIDFVAADATEGFNPSHDLCRALVNAAVTMAERSAGKTIASYEFCLTEWEQHCSEVHDQLCLHLRLDDGLLRQKMSAAADYRELKAEIQQAVGLKGEEYFRIECLRKVTEPFPPLELPARPYYETFGEQRVTEGKYASVIRYREHMLPVLTAIREHATKGVNVHDTAAASRAVAGRL